MPSPYKTKKHPKGRRLLGGDRNRKLKVHDLKVRRKAWHNWRVEALVYILVREENKNNKKEREKEKEKSPS